MNDELCYWDDLYQELLTEGVEPAEIEQRKSRLLAGINAYKLVEVRIRCGLTQQDVATAMGVDLETVRRIENGDLAAIEALAPYATALGGRLRVFIDFGGDMTSISG